MSNERRKLHTNLLQQNCYVRDYVAPVAPVKRDCIKSYTSCDEEVDENGVRLKYTDVPYHITPEYVNSFLDTTDYRKDVQGAVANGVNKPNLGDVTEIQKFMSMNSSAQAALYSQLKAKFEKAASAPASAPAPAPAPAPDKEVK